ncbi:MAG TPA: cytochrome ubiquinol oxidase subunit I, partial [Ancylobacter sp.]
YLTHSWDGEVQGLKAVPEADQPNVPIVFFAFRIMAGIGVVLLATAITGFILRLRGRLYETRWFQFVAMAAPPLGFLAVLSGWTVTEAGRQPWIIYGALRTADAAAPVTAGAVTTSLLIFFAVYNVLLLVFLWFAARVALKGPVDTSPPILGHPGIERSTLDVFATSSTPSPARGTEQARA